MDGAQPYSLEDVREFIRHRLNNAFPNTFAIGCNTSVEALTVKFMLGSDKLNETHCVCENNHCSGYILSYNCAFAPGGTGGAHWNTVQEYINMVAFRQLQVSCTVCSTPIIQYDRFLYAPIILVVLVSGTITPPDLDICLSVNGHNVYYDLQGIIYYGQVHFTARYIDNTKQVWFNDGIQTGRRQGGAGTSARHTG